MEPANIFYDRIAFDSYKTFIDEGRRIVDDLLAINNNINEKSIRLTVLSMPIVGYLVGHYRESNYFIFCIIALVFLILIGMFMYAPHSSISRGAEPQDFLTTQNVNDFPVDYVNSNLMFILIGQYTSTIADLRNINKPRALMLRFQISFAALSAILYIIGAFTTNC